MSSSTRRSALRDLLSAFHHLANARDAWVAGCDRQVVANQRVHQMTKENEARHSCLDGASRIELDA